MTHCNSKQRLLLGALIIFWFISTAFGQVTTVQFTTGVGTPAGAVVLSGSAVNPSTGRPYRHLWTADPVNGLCRMDPDLDTESAHAINPATCITTVQGAALNPGSMTFDSSLNDLYVVDAGGKLGIFRFRFVPSADSGIGLLSTTQQEVLGGSISGGKLVGGCNIPTNTPHAISLGPDENLYVGFSRTGALMRIVSPQTEPLPCTNVQPNVASTPDAKRDAGLAWVGHTLFGIDNTTTFAITNADQCFTPQNGNIACPPLAGTGGIFLVIGGPTAMASDQVYPAIGTKVYISSTTQLFLYNSSAGGNATLYSTFSFANISAVGVDIPPTGSEVVYVGDDPSNGLVAGQGRWWEVTSAPPPPAPPAAPTAVSAVAGNAQATVSWSPVLNGQSTTSYTVRNTFVSTGVPIPDVIVTAPSGSSAPPTSVTITGLTNGTTYQFAVDASNAQGSSAFSAASNPVTPSAPTVPSAPAAVSASGGNASASVAWTVPNNGGSPITSYTVTALVNGAPIGVSATVASSITNTIITGLTNGTTYTFTVHATNALGNGPESLPSPPVTPQPITVSGAPTGVTASAGNTQATVSWTAPSNTGGAPIIFYTVSAQIAGVTVSSVEVSAGTSTVFGGLSNGTTYTFVVTATNAAGAGAVSLPSNAVTPAPPPTTTDIQVVGSAQNGGPASTGSDVFTWQIKDNQSVVANGVRFTTSLPAGMVFQSASSNLGSCTGPAAGTSGGTVSCSLSSLPGGQTMVVTVNVTFNTIGTMTTTGSATFAGTDTNPANNSFSVTIGVK